MKGKPRYSIKMQILKGILIPKKGIGFENMQIVKALYLEIL